MVSVQGTRRARLFVATVCVALLSVGCSGLKAKHGSVAVSASSNAIVASVNAARAQHGLPALSPHGQLDALAGSWSAHMAATGTFTHSNLEATLYRPDFQAFQRLGENILRSECSRAAPEMVDAWLQSPSHRANVLSPMFGVVGVGVVCAPDGWAWVTMNFGSLG
jgi:uncharacterized protein YkwD